MKIKVDSQMLTPQTNDIFFVALKNKNVTPYLIGHDRDNKYLLVNMHSGQSNYKADSIKELVEAYLSAQGKSINGITHYFFAKGHNGEIKHKNPFGHTNVDGMILTKDELVEWGDKISKVRE